MSEFKDYTTIINRWVDDIEFPHEPIGLYEPIKYMLGGGGKRIRPTLLCASAEAFGCDMENVRPQALGIEMFHNFTLLHDDVMDNADLRHGVPTVHRKWNIPTAILSGDTMLTLASQFIGDCKAVIKNDVLKLFNDTSIQIYEGQQYDMNFESRDDVTLNEYVEMIRLKTAVLLGCSCMMGVICAGGSGPDAIQMYKFGELMGLAFQLRDDYLDTYGDKCTFGKEIGGDILNDKKTWLRVKASEISGSELKKLSTEYQGDEKIMRVTQFYTSIGVGLDCVKEIERYTYGALECIESIMSISDDYKQFFRSMALSAINRTH